MIWKALACTLAVAVAIDISEAATPKRDPNEARQIAFAERVIMVQVAREVSIAVRHEREKCLQACPETGALTLGIGTIGCGRSDAATTALLNLIGLILDGEGSEVLDCQLLARGNALIKLLQAMDVSQTAAHCRALFDRLRAHELADVSDVTAAAVCKTPAAISERRDELLTLLRNGGKCDEE